MTKTALDLNWYILATHPRAETKAERGLDLRGVTRFLPRYTKVAKQRGDLRFVERMLIPGYVFAGFERNRDHWQTARETPGVIGFVLGVNRMPYRISGFEIGDLMSKCSFGHYDEDQRRLGARIEFSTVKIGPLVSRETARGRIVSLEKDGMVRVMMLGGRALTFEKMRLDEFVIA